MIVSEEIKHSSHSFTCAKIYTRTPTASREINAKEGRAFIKDFKTRRN